MNETTPGKSFSRRRLLQYGAAAIGTGTAISRLHAEPSRPAVRNGRVKQSIVQWCFQKHWNIEQMCQVARQLGCVSVELVDPKDWPTLRSHGLFAPLP